MLPNIGGRQSIQYLWKMEEVDGFYLRIQRCPRSPCQRLNPLLMSLRWRWHCMRWTFLGPSNQALKIPFNPKSGSLNSTAREGPVIGSFLVFLLRPQRLQGEPWEAVRVWSTGFSLFESSSCAPLRFSFSSASFEPQSVEVSFNHPQALSVCV